MNTILWPPKNEADEDRKKLDPFSVASNFANPKRIKDGFDGGGARTVAMSEWVRPHSDYLGLFVIAIGCRSV